MSNLTYDFSDRSVIVTGAARGIGRELARIFIDAGADTTLVDFDGDVLTQTVAEIGGYAAVADVSSTPDVERVVGEVFERTGRVDILVNNAGILRDVVLWKMTDDDWDLVLKVHLGGTFRFTRACVPHFRAQGFGRVVNVTSYTGLHGNIGQSNYSAAKAGIIGFTKTTAKELARFGVTVNAISPNAETRMIASIPPEKVAELAKGIPMGRFAKPQEMASAVAFLASDDAQYITGVVLPVDGGLSM